MVGARHLNLMETTMNPMKNEPTEVQQPLLMEAADTLMQVNELTLKIFRLADNLCGIIRGSAADIPNKAEPYGAIDRFRAEMRDTRQAMIFADDALTRIEQELIG